MTATSSRRAPGIAAALILLCACGDSSLQPSSNAPRDRVLTRAPTASSGQLTIAILNVGHGDSSLIIFPTGATMLVDSGSSSAGRKVVSPFLKQHGVERLDYYVETHPHGDHTGGRSALGAYIDGNSTRRWDWKSHRIGKELALEGTRWTITNAHDTSANGADTNANSLAYRIEYNGFVYSASGDADLKNEGKAHVRNTAHHGDCPKNESRLNKVNPDFFVVSAPRADWVCRALRNTGKTIYVTGRDGHVAIRASSGRNWDHQLCRTTCSLVDAGSGGSGGGSGSQCENRCSPSCRCDWTEIGCTTDEDCKTGLYCKIRPVLGNRCLKRKKEK